MDRTESQFGRVKSCLICNNKNFEKWAKIGVYQARKCKTCGMISVNPTPDHEFLSRYYAGYSISNKKDHKLWNQRKAVYKIDRDWITKFIDHGKVLDVGCSGGQFLSHFNPKKWTRYGVEVDEGAVEEAKKKFNIKVIAGNILEQTFREKFDLIMFRGVIEHFTNPIKVFKKCSSMLKKNGYLYITATPAGDAFAFDVYREKWRLFTPPDHLHFFTVELLTKVMKKFGFILVDFHYQYFETPYANPKKDFIKIQKDIILDFHNKRNKIQVSNPFPGSMITAVWKKTSG